MHPVILLGVIVPHVQVRSATLRTKQWHGLPWKCVEQRENTIIRHAIICICCVVALWKETVLSVVYIPS